VGKQEYLNLSWNPGKAELELLTAEKIVFSQIPCQVLFINQQEWDMISAVQDQALSHCPQIIVTQGKKGGKLYLNGQDKGNFSSSGVEAVDTTGAGDAFACGYVSGQLLNRSPLESVKMGVQNAGSVVQHYGAKAGLLRKDQMKQVLKKAKI
jgi:ribokinase